MISRVCLFFNKALNLAMPSFPFKSNIQLTWLQESGFSGKGEIREIAPFSWTWINSCYLCVLLIFELTPWWKPAIEMSEKKKTLKIFVIKFGQTECLDRPETLRFSLKSWGQKHLNEVLDYSSPEYSVWTSLILPTSLFHCPIPIYVELREPMLVIGELMSLLQKSYQVGLELPFLFDFFPDWHQSQRPFKATIYMFVRSDY